MHEFVELVKALAWPITVFVIVILVLPELKLFAANLARRIRTDTVTFKGFTLTAPLSSQLQNRTLQFRRYILTVSDGDAVEAISKRLNLPASTTTATARKSVLAEMGRRVASDQDMDEFSTLLRRITKQDF